VDQLMRQAAATPGVIGFGGGLPAEAQFPRDELARSFVRVLRQQGSPALQYGWPEGLDTLRARIAARLRARAPTLQLDADDVLVTSGAQQAIAIAVQLLSSAGDQIGLDPESYPAALDLFRARRLQAVALGQGRAAYVMPAVANPSGLAMSAAARVALRARQQAIIEDDAYADLRFHGAAEAPLLADERARARTFHVGTFSKTLCPGLRVGWLIAPRRLRRRALRLKQTNDLQSNSLAQAVLDDYLAHHDFDARLAVLRRFYRRRASRLAEAVRRALPGWHFVFPEGGFGLWLQTDDAADEVRLLRAAIAEGVSFDAGSQFRWARAAGQPLAMRLCFSLARPADFEEGARRLARAWRSVAGGATRPLPLPQQIRARSRASVPASASKNRVR